jgi:hypothetical protein
VDATETLKAACQTASAETARIDAKIRDKLLKRAHRLGMTTNEREVIELVEAWKRAARKTKRVRRRHGHHKG